MIYVLALFLVIAAVERWSLVRRFEETIESERVSARVERSELVARVQGLSWRPEPRKTPTEVLAEEPDELGMVGTIQYGESDGK